MLTTRLSATCDPRRDPQLGRVAVALCALVLSTAAPPRADGPTPCQIKPGDLGVETLPPWPADGLLVTVDGIPVGELRPGCDLRDELCTGIPSGAIARAIGMDRDCGRVNAVELAECLTIEVIPNLDGGRLILRSWQGGKALGPIGRALGPQRLSCGRLQGCSLWRPLMRALDQFKVRAREDQCQARGLGHARRHAAATKFGPYRKGHETF